MLILILPVPPAPRPALNRFRDFWVHEAAHFGESGVHLFSEMQLTQWKRWQLYYGSCLLGVFMLPSTNRKHLLAFSVL